MSSVLAVRVRKGSTTVSKAKTPTRSKFEIDDPFFDVAGAAAYLGRSERWVRGAVAERRVPYVKMNKRLAFRKSALDAWVEAHTVEAE